MKAKRTLVGSPAYKEGHYAGSLGMSENDRLKDYCQGVSHYLKKHGAKRVNEYGSYSDYQKGYAEGIEHRTRVANHLKQISDRLREEKEK